MQFFSKASFLFDTDGWYCVTKIKVRYLLCVFIFVASLYWFCKVAVIALSSVGSILVLQNRYRFRYCVAVKAGLRIPLVKLSFLFFETVIMKPC